MPEVIATSRLKKSPAASERRLLGIASTHVAAVAGWMCAEASPLSKLHKLYTASALVGSLFAYCTARGDHVSLCYVRADKTTGDHVSLCYVCADKTMGDHVSLCYVCSDKTTGDHVSLCYVCSNETTLFPLCYVCADKTTGYHVSLCYVGADKTTGEHHFRVMFKRQDRS